MFVHCFICIWVKDIRNTYIERDRSKYYFHLEMFTLSTWTLLLPNEQCWVFWLCHILHFTSICVHLHVDLYVRFKVSHIFKSNSMISIHPPWRLIRPLVLLEFSTEWIWTICMTRVQKQKHFTCSNIAHIGKIIHSKTNYGDKLAEWLIVCKKTMNCCAHMCNPGSTSRLHIISQSDLYSSCRCKLVNCFPDPLLETEISINHALYNNISWTWRFKSILLEVSDPLFPILIFAHVKMSAICVCLSWFVITKKTV